MNVSDEYKPATCQYCLADSNHTTLGSDESRRCPVCGADYTGDVISRGDGQAHFIGYEQLIRLYGVNPTMCVKARDGWDRTYSPEFRQQFVHLYPRYDGEYQVDGLPNVTDDRANAKPSRELAQPPLDVSTEPTTDIRADLLKALKRDWLVKLQINHPIDTIETLQPAANDFAENQLAEYEEALLNTQLALERAAIKHALIGHSERTVSRDTITNLIKERDV